MRGGRRAPPAGGLRLLVRAGWTHRRAAVGFRTGRGQTQALEWLFCEAAGHRFRVSLDNLSGEATDSLPFRQRVLAQVHDFLDNGIPERPACFIDALLTHYRPGQALTPEAFTLERL